MPDNERGKTIEENTSPINAGASDNLVLDLYFGSAEKTQQRSAWVDDTYQAPYNPDDLYKKSGDYKLYEDMKKDDQVSVCMQLKKDLILGSGWDIVTEKEGDSELSDTIFSRLDEDPEIAIEDMLDDFIDTCYSFGFAVAEKRFMKRPDNSLTFKSLTTRHPNSWLLHTDNFGNITKFEQHGADADIAINPKSLMYSTVGNSLVGPYGKSDLRAAYDAYFIKRHITRFYSIFLEKAASPIPVARYDKSIPDAKITKLSSIIKNFQTKTSLTIPKEIEIEFLETPNQGDVYVKGINLFNMFIGRALLVPDLLGFTGEGSSQGGSQALGREQVEIFFKHINRRRKTLERLVNRHIVQPMVVYNEGFQELYPKFKLKPISDDKAIEYAKVFIEAMRGNMYKPSEDEINHFRGLVNFPEGEVEFKEAPAGQAGGFPFGGPMPGQAPSVNPELKPESDDPMAALNKEQEPDKKEFKQVFKPAEGNYSDKTDFKAVEATLESGESATVNSAVPVVTMIFDDLYEQIKKKKIINGADSKPERIKTIKLRKLKDLQRILKENFKDSYQKHRAIARAELFKQTFNIDVPDAVYLKWLDDETFEYIGAWAYRVTENAAVEMRNAIRDGRPPESVISVLDAQGKEDSLTSIRRYSRTKQTEIANQARLREFRDSKIVQGLQYNAVLDGVTTVLCAGLHGKVFTMENCPLPPNHFNCRSIVTPITIFEPFEQSTSVNKDFPVRDVKGLRGKIPDSSLPIPDFVKKHGGKGFVDKSGIDSRPDLKKVTKKKDTI